MLKNSAIVPYIPVSNVARAREFYEKKVGLQPKEEYAGGVVYECGSGSFVFMYPTPNAGTNKASTTGRWIETVKWFDQNATSRSRNGVSLWTCASVRAAASAR